MADHGGAKDIPTITEVLSDPTAPLWLKTALRPPLTWSMRATTLKFWLAFSNNDVPNAARRLSPVRRRSLSRQRR